MALCLFAVAIVFYQTSAVRYRGGDDAIQLDRSSVYKHMQQLSEELETLEKEYKTDVLRLEGTWL